MLRKSNALHLLNCIARHGSLKDKNIRLAAMCLFMTTAFASCSSYDYVPNSGWENSEEASAYENWFENQLKKIHEPSFRRGDALSGFRSRTRLLVLRDRGDTSLIKIDEMEDGRFHLNRIRFSTEDDENEIISSLGRDLSQSEVNRIFSVINGYEFRELERNEPDESSVWFDEDGNYHADICFHPTQYVFEILDSSDHVFILRDSCSDDSTFWGAVNALRLEDTVDANHQIED